MVQTIKMCNFVRMATLLLATATVNPELKRLRDRMTHKMLNEVNPKIISQEVSEEEKTKHQDLGAMCPKRMMANKQMNTENLRLQSQIVNQEDKQKQQNLGSMCPKKMMANKQLNTENQMFQSQIVNERGQNIRQDLGSMCPKKMMANKQLNTETLRLQSEVVNEEDKKKQQMQQDINHHISSGLKLVPAKPKIETNVFRLFPPECINRYDEKLLKTSKTS
ncbi:uncharacterized protein LOC124354075 isoform X2 [Homalodisca vitripennis]|uniref:uncharacterized protein LOC124354075 isoform X2 n=1 Tax=Homalodisca vitripennis TaxID=197043 RepID=UPI001EECEE47|nr:uncharacterized protein LOC124354075 isoform X2 [Homalodisca vitripennis]